ncbi:MAG: DUF1080 domain-containing protein [Spirosomataceae bacterium]
MFIALPNNSIGCCPKEKWTPLFDGKSFKGWKQLNGQAKYTIENGEMVGTTVANTPNSFMATEKEYGDFILELDLKVDNSMNSGIQIRSLSTPITKIAVCMAIR